MHNLVLRVQELEGELAVTGERCKQGLSELTCKEEELVVLRVEMVTLQDKYKHTVDNEHQVKVRDKR